MSASAIRAGAAYIELMLRDKASAALKSASKNLHAFGTSADAMGQRMSLLGAAITAPLIAMAHQVANAGSGLNDMSERTGASTEAMSELGYAAGVSGASIEAVEKALVKMNGTIGEAAAGSKTAQEALAAVGMTASRLSGLSPDQQFEAIAAAIASVPNPARRAALAMDIFGKSGQELIPLIAKGVDGIEELRQEARDLGVSMSGEDAQAAATFGDALNRMKTSLLGLRNAIGSALLPILATSAERVTRAIVNAIEWAKANRELVVTILQVGFGITAAGIALIAIGKVAGGLGTVFGLLATATSMIGSAIGVLGTVLASLMSPLGAVLGGLAAFGAYMVYTSGVGGEALQWLSNRFGELRDDALAAWKGIGDALAAGDIGLAAKILWLTLKMEFMKGVDYLNQLWAPAKKYFMQVWSDAGFGIARLLNNIWADVARNAAEAMAGIGIMFDNIGHGFSKAWGEVVDMMSREIITIQGLFDPSIDELAAHKEIADMRKRTDNAANAQTLQSAIDRKAAFEKAKTDIDTAQATQNTNLAAAQAQEDTDRQTKFNTDLTATAEEAKKAREEWTNAIAEAAKKRAEVEDPSKMKKFELPSFKLPEMLSQQQNELESKGTFSAFAVRGLGADSLAERTARATEATAVNAAAMRQLLAERGPVAFA